MNESQTRSLLINPQLLAAGWKLSVANGRNTWFWDVGLAHPRLVAGFFSPADLERLLSIRRNRQPLAATPINSSIVDRAYQHEAIRRVCEAFERGLRRALLVMATGRAAPRE